MIISAVDVAIHEKRLWGQARDAREWFAVNGPPDLQPLPIDYNERETVKRGDFPHKMLAWYARSLACRDFNVEEHPSFEDYARGVMASKHAPDFITQDQRLRERFPPQPLASIDAALCWDPPKKRRTRAPRYRRTCARTG